MTQNLKTRAYFLKIFMALHMKNFKIPKLRHLGPGAKKLVQGNLDLKLFEKTYQDIR